MFSSGYRYIVVAAVVVLIVSSSAIGGTIRHDRSDSAYVALGAQTAYASVGRLDFTERTDDYMGSGTLIASNWVLTAGHCVEAATSMTFTVAGKQYQAVEWVAHPQWAGNLMTGYDIGLVRLAESVEDVAPAVRYRGTAETRKTATFVGYGMTGTGLTGATKPAGEKRAGQNVLDTVQGGKKGRILLVDFDNPNNRKDSRYGSSTPLDLEYLVSFGDSGGGAFIEEKGKVYLAGVTSFVMSWDGKTNCDYGDAAGFIRVSMLNDWIDAVLAGAALYSLSLDGSPVGLADAAAVPEPASMLLLLVPGAALLRRRRA